MRAAQFDRQACPQFLQKVGGRCDAGLNSYGTSNPTVHIPLPPIFEVP
jgi:hypothetical protein